MDCSFTEEQQMLKVSVRNFLGKEIAPVVNAHEKKVPLTKAETTVFIKQLPPFGYLTGFLPEKYGGHNWKPKPTESWSKNCQGSGPALREPFSSLRDPLGS